MAEHGEQTSNGAFPGDVLVAACGFVVTAAAWTLFGFLEGELTFSSSATVFFILALAHLLAGVMIFGRRSYAAPAGIAVGIGGLIVAGLSPQYVLVFTNCVILVLVVLARGNVVVRPHES